jgi:hypothetical protein
MPSCWRASGLTVTGDKKLSVVFSSVKLSGSCGGRDKIFELNAELRVFLIECFVLRISSSFIENV